MPTEGRRGHREKTSLGGLGELLRDAAKTRRRRRLRYGGSVKMRQVPYQRELFGCRGTIAHNING
jgi:hypothetical protein